MGKGSTRSISYHGRCFISPCLFTACLLVAMLFASAHAKTADGKDLLQFTSKGHILGFSPGSMYMASGSHMLKVEFLGGKSVSPVSKEGPSSDGKAPPLSKVTYPNIWDGVDIVYEGAKGSIVKSTYTVAAGKAPGSIRLRYNRPLTLDEKGNLVVRYETGTITESKPIAWQVIEGKKKPVMVAYNLQSDKEVGFTVKDYDKSVPLVIDPLLAWTTYLGADGSDQAYAIALDSGGNVYVAGFSDTAWGSPVQAYTSGNDAFVAKLTTDGSLLWNTFLGGSGSDYGYAVALDPGGNVYVAGYSNATWGSPVQAYTSGNDAFVAKLTTDGSLLWNTFLGSRGTEVGYDIAVDSGGNVYVAGVSNATWGSPIRAYTSGNDAFVAKLTTDGSLVWNTFFGGSGSDYGYAVALDPGANVYVAGYSNATWGSPIRAYTSGNDAFVAKLTTDGSLLWNTFLGGRGTEVGYDIAVDSGGNAYVAGVSSATWGSPIRAYTSGNDAFVAKLTTDGSLVWNTFFGGSGFDYGYAVALDSGGNVYVAGYSNATWGSPVRAFSGGIDSYVTRLTTDGSFLWNTFLGGSGGAYAQAIALDSSGDVYVTGLSDLIWGQPYNDAFVAKTFASDAYALSVSRAGAGTGTVTSSPSGIDCGSACSTAFVVGKSVTLTAAPSTGSIFTGWGGACSGTGACTVTITADATVTATFAPETLTVAASVSSGHGSISPDIQTVSYGNSATITMKPDTGYHIASFTDNGTSITGVSVKTSSPVGKKTSGSRTKSAAKTTASGKTSISNPYTIRKVTVDHTVVATYEIDTEGLTATMDGTGTGTLCAEGLTCSGTKCSGTYPYDTSVTITAAPDAGTLFEGFTGCDSTSGSTCMVKMTAGKSITATFTAICTYTITPTEKSFASKGGSTSVTVRATGAKSCVDPGVSAGEDSWITATLSSFKNNKGTVKLAVQANDAITDRIGTVTIGRNIFTIIQTGVACSIGISPSKATLVSSGGTGSFTVTAPTGCPWTVEGDPSATAWLSALTISGSGAGPVSYKVSENGTGRQRSGKITVYLTNAPGNMKAFTVTEKK